MDKSGPERTIKIREYDLLWIKMDQKESPRSGNMIYYGKNGSERISKIRDYNL